MKKDLKWWLDKGHIEATSVKGNQIYGMPIEEYNETPLKYVMIYDSAVVGKKLKNMIKAINIMCQNGWKVISYNEYRDIAKSVTWGGVRGQALLERVS